MQIVNTLPVKEAVLVAIAVSSFLTVVLAVMFYRRTKGGVSVKRKRTRPAGAEKIRATAVANRDQEMVREVEAMILKINSALERLEIALKRCTEILDQLGEESTNTNELHIVHSPEPGSKVIKNRVARLIASGADEKDIASTLSLTDEQLKLYMHSVKEDKEAVQV